MSKKDYEVIAVSVAATVRGSDRYQDRERSIALHTCWEIAQELSAKLAKDNPRFDRERFLKACEVV